MTGVEGGLAEFWSLLFDDDKDLGDGKGLSVITSTAEALAAATSYSLIG